MDVHKDEQSELGSVPELDKAPESEEPRQSHENKMVADSGKPLAETSAERDGAYVAVEKIHGTNVRQEYQDQRSKPEGDVDADEQETAAIKLQANFRGYHTRKVLNGRRNSKRSNSSSENSPDLFISRTATNDEATLPVREESELNAAMVKKDENIFYGTDQQKAEEEATKNQADLISSEAAYTKNDADKYDNAKKELTAEVPVSTQDPFEMLLPVRKKGPQLQDSLELLLSTRRPNAQPIAPVEPPTPVIAPKPKVLKIPGLISRISNYLPSLANTIIILVVLIPFLWAMRGLFIPSDIVTSSPSIRRSPRHSSILQEPSNPDDHNENLSMPDIPPVQEESDKDHKRSRQDRNIPPEVTEQQDDHEKSLKASKNSKVLTADREKKRRKKDLVVDKNSLNHEDVVIVDNERRKKDLVVDRNSPKHEHVVIVDNEEMIRVEKPSDKSRRRTRMRPFPGRSFGFLAMDKKIPLASRPPSPPLSPPPTTTTTTKKFSVNYLRDALKGKPDCVAPLSRASNIDEKVIQRFLNGDRTITLDTIDHLADALDLRAVFIPKDNVKSTSKKGFISLL
ncbi:unnamed protein product [Didymodactylos carnosus]|nr:unnamed protein product [Didymodactylos carnosus]CAF4076022.1 unnamed protein product [Didymodactylos carnosus]